MNKLFKGKFWTVTHENFKSFDYYKMFYHVSLVRSARSKMSMIMLQIKGTSQGKMFLFLSLLLLPKEDTIHIIL